MRVATDVTALNRLTRYQHWQVKLADLSLFVGYALAVQLPSSRLFLTGCLCLSACAALAVFGYAWNDACDAGPDSQAGKDRPVRSQSRAIALFALAVAIVFLAAVARVDALLLALAFAAVLLAWAYSGRPLRLKERGGLGLLAGALAQRTLPAVFIAVAFELSVLQTVPWLVWMTCWGLRGMVIHQAQDAEHDRLSGLATWGARAEPREPERLIAVLVPIEAAALVVALLPLVAQTSVRIGSITLLTVWSLFVAAALWQLHARSRRIDWLSFRYMPLEELSSVVAPGVVALALALVSTGGAAALAWVALDATVRAPALWRTWRRLAGLSAFWLDVLAERFARKRAARTHV